MVRMLLLKKNKSPDQWDGSGICNSLNRGHTQILSDQILQLEMAWNSAAKPNWGAIFQKQKDDEPKKTENHPVVAQPEPIAQTAQASDGKSACPCVAFIISTPLFSS